MLDMKMHHPLLAATNIDSIIKNVKSKIGEFVPNKDDPEDFYTDIYEIARGLVGKRRKANKAIFDFFSECKYDSADSLKSQQILGQA